MNSTIKNNFSIMENLYFMHKRANGITIETNLEAYCTILEEIQAYNLTQYTDGELIDIHKIIKQRVRSGESLDTLLPMAYALVGEVCTRLLHQTPYDVQILTGIVLHQGKLAEMKTGEGKTLAAVMPAYLNALTGKGVHILTANDYLAKRDARWMGPVYEFFSLSVASVHDTMSIAERKAAYEADITYLTAKQAGFDFLYDGLQYRRDLLVQREFNMVIVDEADFIMIDEARIPLVIAGKVSRNDMDPYRINEVVGELELSIDYIVDKNGRKCTLTEPGMDKVQTLLGCGGIHEQENITLYAAVNVALHAHTLLRRDVDYIIKNDRVELIDEFTGRVAEKRRWPHGIQTALEAKEGLPIQPEGKVCNSITIQNFITQYPKIAAFTATAVPSAAEFSDFYNLDIVIIPPFKPNKMISEPDRIYRTREAKIKAVIDEICRVHATGRPILVGTSSIKESQQIADLLRKNRIPCSVLNAKNDEREAELIAKAGMLGAVTISTNMAGRGTDIKLGGEQGINRDAIIELGGLYVIGTNKHESVRIDNQLRGRAGRQGDPGSSVFFVSLEDDLVTRYGLVELIPERCLPADPGTLIEDRRAAKEIEAAQRILEDQHFQIKNTLCKYFALVEKQRSYLQQLRREALVHDVFPDELWGLCEERITALSPDIDRLTLMDGLRHIFLYYVDEFWASYLAYVDEMREGIHLYRYAGEQPIHVFIKEVSTTFDEGLETLIEEVAERFNTVEITADGIAIEREGLQGPSNTWTYLINDNPLPNVGLSLGAAKGIAFAAAAPFLMMYFMIRSMVKRFKS